MFKEYLGELHVSSLTSAFSGGTNGNVLAVLNTIPEIIFFDLNSGGPTGIKKATLSRAYHSGAFITSSKVALFSNSSNIPAVVDITTGTQTDLTSQSLFAFSSTKLHQLVAGNVSGSRALACSSTAGNLLTFDATGSPVSGKILPSGLGSKTFSAVIRKPGTNDYIVGSTTGEVYEITFSGTVNKTITLPTTPNSGSAVSHPVSSLAMDGDDLYVVTAHGFIFHYTYSSSTLLETMMSADNQSINSGAGMVSEVVNRQFVYGHSLINGSTNGGVPFPLKLIADGTIDIDYFTLFTSGSERIRSLGLAANRAWFASVPTSGSPLSGRVYLWEMDGLATSTPNTRGQLPEGVDTDHRAIRLNRFNNYLYTVDSDQDVPSGEQPVSSNISDVDQLEVSIVDQSPNFYVSVRGLTP